MQSLLLGAAAGFVGLTGAQAADLPGKAAPAEYVRICDTYGAGFFFIPGTDTCLRIGGFVRVDYVAQGNPGTGTNVSGGVGGNNLVSNLPNSTFDQQYGTNVRLTLNVDARSNTEYGLLRAFGQFSAYRALSSGGFSSGGQVNSGVAMSQRQSNILLERAFIQFAGFTFGFSASFFNFYQGDVSFARPYGATATSTTVLAYTASFGSGFSATISLEDGMYRRIGNQDAWVVTAAAPAAASLTRPLSGLYGMTYGANAIPDIVGNLRVDQGWGSLQVMAAAHQLRDYGSLVGGGPAAISGIVYPGAGSVVQRAGDRWGFAVGAGLRLNLDMLARGDQFWLQAVYADGALDYAFSTANQGGDRQTISGAGNLSANNSLIVQMRDAIVNPATNTIQTTKAWSVTAGFRHFWTPAVRSAIFGGYTEVNAPFVSGANISDFRYMQVGVNTIWSPVRNLDLGLEVVYHNIRARDQNGLAIATPAGTNATLGRTSEGVWTAILRAQRNF